jgi:hypothetical protein
LTDSVQWDELPAPVRRAIEEHTGPVTQTAPGGEGGNSSLRLILRTARGSMFAKGTGPRDDESRVWMLEAGVALSPYVTAITPPLLWQVHESGWNIAGFEYLPGRPWADQKPGSPDIPAMLAVLTALASITAPEILTVTAADCWGRYASDPAALAGDALVHRDPNPTNFVVGGDRAWLVDWGWAVRGPADGRDARAVADGIRLGSRCRRAGGRVRTRLGRGAARGSAGVRRRSRAHVG